ncbi:ribosome quality control complex subunit NEMF homolog [Culicoides brevitarsis]|uniref:ribosome quality control complex subunit NEMF homolog n=1 Tax=Culicoides brevitarsis TaxID=469753 RepID=UPI00307BC4BC
MKTRFNTFDIVCQVTDLQRLVGMRVNQIYDVDNKTYLIRFHRNEEKSVLLLESGIRFHTTNFEWPHGVAPSGFTMKMRKHLKNKRLEKLSQLGVDRIIDLQFGTGEAAYHIIVEMYDRGNIVLCDHEYMILNILRYHIDSDVVKFAVKEKYPLHLARQYEGVPSVQKLKEVLAAGRAGDSLRTVLNPVLPYGASLIDHVLTKHDLILCRIKGNSAENDEKTDETHKKKQKKNKKKDQLLPTKDFDMQNDLNSLLNAINDADLLLKQAMETPSEGFLIQKKEQKPIVKEGEDEFYYTNLEYQPMLYAQYENEPFKRLPTFDASIDEFYSELEGQRIDNKAFQTEKEALKKLSNVKDDHAKRVQDLSKSQQDDIMKGELITRNQELVDRAILAIRSALANQMSWSDIQELVKAAQTNGDEVAKAIKQLKLEINHVALSLTDPYSHPGSDGEEDGLKPMTIDIDLGLSAFANARKYYDMKRSAAIKEKKTIDASEKAMKNAERRTQTALKQLRTQTKISKARKTYWFEKFYWFISSENYLVIGGRDQQQNEVIVKRYMKPHDVYVHAEIQGASSVIIKNPTGEEVPPKTLLEAGTMAISYSVAWDAKIVTSAYWVKGDQVSKTAPTGEYLATGSFMIRGKRNFLPPCNLILGLSFLFKLEEGSVERHKNERRVRTFDEEKADAADLAHAAKEEDDTEIDLSKESDTEEITQTEEKIEKLEISDKKEAENEEIEFPDTQVSIKHDFARQESALAEEIVREKLSMCEGDADQELIIASQPVKIKQQMSKKTKQANRQEKKDKKGKQQEQKSMNQDKSGGNQLKRGQKSKLKKIKEKYKDQDEDERQLRMQILQSAGNKKIEEEVDSEDESSSKTNQKQQRQKPQPNNADEDLDDTPAAAEVDMIDTLTGLPVPEDELLFAIPVVAPYQTLQNYKFKVKLTPGSGKRGKAAKTALEIFVRDKNCSQHEKDLLRAVKDETLARNIPGKVKLSAPQMHKVKK